MKKFDGIGIASARKLELVFEVALAVIGLTGVFGLSIAVSEAAILESCTGARERVIVGV